MNHILLKTNKQNKIIFFLFIIKDKEKVFMRSLQVIGFKSLIFVFLSFFSLLKKEEACIKHTTEIKLTYINA